MGLKTNKQTQSVRKKLVTLSFLFQSTEPSMINKFTEERSSI